MFASSAHLVTVHAGHISGLQMKTKLKHNMQQTVTACLDTGMSADDISRIVQNNIAYYYAGK